MLPCPACAFRRTPSLPATAPTRNSQSAAFCAFSRARGLARRIVERFDVRAPDGDPEAKALSGGNLQKFVVGRELDRRPGVLAVSQPTWGVDVGAATRNPPRARRARAQRRGRAGDQPGPRRNPRDFGPHCRDIAGPALPGNPDRRDDPRGHRPPHGRRRRADRYADRAAAAERKTPASWSGSRRCWRSALTLVFGTFLFAALGYDPLRALYVYFVKPLTEAWSLAEIVVKATPLALIGVGLAVVFRANVWNIGAEGQYTVGAICGSILPVMLPDLQGPLLLPAVLVCGALGGMAWAAIPAFFRVRFGASEILTSLMLVYVAQLLLDWLVRGPWRNPEGYNFPESRLFEADAVIPALAGRMHFGTVFAPGRGRSICNRPRAHPQGVRIPGHRGGAPRGRLRRLLRTPLHHDRADDFRRARRHCGYWRSVGHHRAAPPVHLSRLRLHGHHRRLPRAAEPGGRAVRVAAAGAHLYRRRGGPGLARRLRQDRPRVPGGDPDLRAGLRCVHSLPPPLPSRCGARRRAAGDAP